MICLLSRASVSGRCMDSSINGVSNPTNGKTTATDRFTSLFDSMHHLMIAFVSPSDIIARCIPLNTRICYLAQRDIIWRRQLLFQTYNGIPTCQSRLRADTIDFLSWWSCMNNLSTNGPGIRNGKVDDAERSTIGPRPSLYSAWQLAMIICSSSCINDGSLNISRLESYHCALALMLHPSITVYHHVTSLCPFD
jgi:hypothetical protein